MAKTFSINEALLWGFDALKRHALLLLGVGAIMWAVEFPFGLFQGLIQLNVFNLSHYVRLTLLIITACAQYLIWQGFMAGMIKIYLDIYDTDHASYTTLFSGFRRLPSFFVLGALWAVVVLLGFIALIIPGIYLLLQYSQALKLFVDKDLGIVDSFKESARLTQGLKWRLLEFDLTVLGFSILAVVVSRIFSLIFFVVAMVLPPVFVAVVISLLLLLFVYFFSAWILLAGIHVYRSLGKQEAQSAAEIAQGAE